MDYSVYDFLFYHCSRNGSHSDGTVAMELSYIE